MSSISANYIHPGYKYFTTDNKNSKVENKKESTQLSSQILTPKITNPNYIVLKKRREILSNWIYQLPHLNLKILDVGGRLQPYRILFEKCIDQYIGIDPIFEGMVDVIGWGESLPFSNEKFDVVICTQVLNYSKNPFEFISEIYRVLKIKGVLFLSTPAIFPYYHDQRWRFMTNGLEVLLSNFSMVEIVPEDNSMSGFFRSVNLFFDTLIRHYTIRRLVSLTIYPVINLSVSLLDSLCRNSTQFSSNYISRAIK